MNGFLNGRYRLRKTLQTEQRVFQEYLTACSSGIMEQVQLRDLLIFQQQTAQQTFLSGQTFPTTSSQSQCMLTELSLSISLLTIQRWNSPSVKILQLQAAIHPQYLPTQQHSLTQKAMNLLRQATKQAQQ